MREVVSAAFVDGWTAAAPGVPYALENEVLALPESGNYATLTVTTTTSAQLTTGGPGTRKVQRNGWLVVKLWEAANTGGLGLSVLIDKVRSVFEMKNFASPVSGDQSLTTFATNGEPGGTDGRWAMALARTPFWYTETK